MLYFIETPINKLSIIDNPFMQKVSLHVYVIIEQPTENNQAELFMHTSMISKQNPSTSLHLDVYIRNY